MAHAEWQGEKKGHQKVDRIRKEMLRISQCTKVSGEISVEAGSGGTEMTHSYYSGPKFSVYVLCPAKKRE